MNELKELIGEGEHIRAEMVSALESDSKVKVAWSTVVRWYEEAMGYVEKHSNRPIAGLEEYLDVAGETNTHYEQIDRVLNRLRGIQAAER